MRLIVSLLTFFAFAQIASAEEQWRTLAPLPEARSEVGVAATSSQVFVVGGNGPNGPVSSLFVFESATGAWSQGAPVPGPARDHIGVAVVDEKLYAIGGLTWWPGGAVASVFVYHPRTNEWKPRASLPRPRGAMGIAVFDGRIYAIGGLAGGQAVADVDVYDPETDHWQPSPPMPTARDHLMAAAVNGKVYAIGGRAKDIQAVSGANEAFDPHSNRWTSLAPLPTPRGGGGAAALFGRIFVFGGEHPSGTFADTEIFDLRTNIWSKGPNMPTARHGTGGAVAGDTIIVPGGGTAPGFSTSNVVEALTVQPPTTICPAGGNSDSDGDGFSDETEGTAATDPCDASSRPSVPEPNIEEPGEGTSPVKQPEESTTNPNGSSAKHASTSSGGGCQSGPGYSFTLAFFLTVLILIRRGPWS